MTVYSFFHRVMESFHPFASRAARHHGVLLDRYSAKNLAYICGFDREFDDFVANSQATQAGFLADHVFDTHLLVGREGILMVDRYLSGARDLTGSEQKIFTFPLPEWLSVSALTKGCPPNPAGAQVYGLKSELDRRGYGTSWEDEKERGNEFRINFQDDYAIAFRNGDNLIYSGADDAEQEEAIKIAMDFGFEFNMPPTMDEVALITARHSSARPNSRELRLMEDSRRYHED